LKFDGLFGHSKSHAGFFILGNGSGASVVQPASHCAYIVVNFSGMCWVMAMPGASAGKLVSTNFSAYVPPC
jgi:hypothetical protein